ncbi:MAG: glycosyltransferase family 4 protein, partial [bacterium]
VVVVEGFGGSRIPRLAPLYVKEPIITEWRQIYARIFPHQFPRILSGPLAALESFTAWVHRNTVVLAFTPEWQEAFQTLGFRRENIFRVPVSIPDEWLRVDGHQRVVEPRVIWIGKFHRYKCPHHLIEAMAHVVEEVPDARLVLAGRRSDSKFERQLKRLARDLGLAGRVEFLFNIAEEEKWALLRRCRVLALPSSVEGFGIVVLEANASGLPVIASSGVPEGAVRHGGNGLRYPFGDIRALAGCIIRLLKDEELHATLSANGRMFAQQFGWQSVGEQFEAVVRHALDRRRRDKVGPSSRPRWKSER